MDEVETKTRVSNWAKELSAESLKQHEECAMTKIAKREPADEND
jgi:hypothetical protein